MVQKEFHFHESLVPSEHTCATQSLLTEQGLVQTFMPVVKSFAWLEPCRYGQTAAWAFPNQQFLFCLVFKA